MKKTTKTILKIVAGIMAVAIVCAGFAVESATRQAKMASVGSSLNTIGHRLREMEAEGKPEPKTLKEFFYSSDPRQAADEVLVEIEQVMPLLS